MDTRASPEEVDERERPRRIDGPTATSSQSEAQPQMAYLHNNGDDSGAQSPADADLGNSPHNPCGGILRHPRTVPQRSQEAFTATVGGPREPRSRGKDLLSWAEGTTTDAWPSGSTICSLAGGRSPGPSTMAPGLERGPPYQGLRGDRRASPRGGFPQPRENVRSPVTLDPSPFFCTFPKTQEI